MSTIVFILPFLVVYTILVVYAERKISAFMQSRLGPMEVGYYGLLQTVADLLKLLQKEDIVPMRADKFLFQVAPLVIFVVVFAGFSVLPLAPEWNGSTIESGVFFLLAVISLDVIGIFIAGWSSNNKYGILGTIRSIAQIVSYEVPLGLAVICVIITSQSMNLQEISLKQGILGGTSPVPLLGFNLVDVSNIGGILSWNIFQQPLLFPAWVIYFIASLAECNRAPFDLPEAESELVAGYHTEYSGFRWATIMLAEYAMMLLVSFGGAILFFGSWNTPLPNIGSVQLAAWTTGPVWGIFWLVGKTLIFVVIQIWIRWTYPRLRIDQLMNISWKWLTPAALLLLLLCSVWRLVM